MWLNGRHQVQSSGVLEEVLWSAPGQSVGGDGWAEKRRYITWMGIRYTSHKSYP